MKPKLLLRIGALFMLLHTMGHSIGALTWKQAPTPAIGRVITGMQNEHFMFSGRSVTLGSFFEGYGISMIFVLLFITAFLWLLSTATDNVLTSKLLLPLGLLLAALAVTEYIYFFLVPAACTLIAAVCSLAALAGMRRAKL